MSADSNQLIDKVVDVTNVKDRLSLDQIVILAIKNLLGDANINLYRAIPHVDSFYYVVSTQSNTLSKYESELVTKSFAQLQQDPLFARCYSNQHMQADESRCVWPLSKLGIHYGFIEINNIQQRTEQQAVVDNFVAIYCNLSYLINEAEKDTLTGLYNRKTLDGRLEQLLQHAQALKKHSSQQGRSDAEKRHYWIALIDIDHFKTINDTYGHAYGDEVLITISKLMQKKFRKEDLLFRYGGEEFIVIIDATTEDTALMVLNRFRQSVEQHHFSTIGRVTISAGVTKVDLMCPSTTLVGQADKALYFSKSHGRNCVSYYQDLVQHGKVAEPKFDNDIELF
ncbi:diguanylate cyclase [Catenovulum agarivorans DS-2]|uniref:diguanylate cyclase n=1 Tax=Catenovulum agarivorans DS-2 TaxID=1328313 RepID=W7QRW1_9ALTE|nr:GGDEF domain-containing protein [Catenovulum agarivorans]EWH08140.1 diguanylate cyclase [Catenovulum agarivorans DS-2]